MVSESNWRREHAQRPKSWLGLGKLFSSTNWVANPTDSTMKLGKNLCWKLGIHDRFKIFLWRLTTNVFPNRIRMLKFKKPFKASKKMRLASTCFLHCHGSLVWPMLEHQISGNPSQFMLRPGQNNCRSSIYNSK